MSSSTPRKYTKELVDRGRLWILANGLTDASAPGPKLPGSPGSVKAYCEYLGIHESTHRGWLKKRPEYSLMVEEAIREYSGYSEEVRAMGRASAVALLAERTKELMSVAIRMASETQNVKSVKVRDVERKTEYGIMEHVETITEVTTREVPPNPQLLLSLLKVLFPDLFSEKADISITEKPGAGMSMDEAREYLRQMDIEN